MDIIDRRLESHRNMLMAEVDKIFREALESIYKQYVDTYKTQLNTTMDNMLQTLRDAHRTPEEIEEYFKKYVDAAIPLIKKTAIPEIQMTQRSTPVKVV